MKNRVFGGLLALLFISLASYAQANVIVNFGGNLSNFNPGPFDRTSDYSGSFEINTSITPTGSLNSYNGAVINFTVSIFEPAGTKVFTGIGGRLRQYRSGSTDFVEIALNNNVCCGSVSGRTDFSYTNTSTGLPDTGTFTLSSISFDLRGSNLFTDPLQVATNLTTGDFNKFASFTMNFTRTGTGVPIGNWSSINRGSSINNITFQGATGQASNVPEPGGLSLLLLGLFACYRMSRRSRI